jgi:hypothetical protein
MTRAGRSLEILVANLEEALREDNRTQIQSPAFLPDKTTGNRREHDVLLVVDQGHHNLRIAMECRDRSRPVGVNQVEAFATKCRETGIDSAVIVSSSGFYASARKKAEGLGVRCLELKEVESPSLTDFVGLDFHIADKIKHNIVVSLSVDRPGDYRIMDRQGREVDLMKIALSAMREYQIRTASDPGHHVARTKVTGDGFVAICKASGEEVPIKAIWIETEFDVAVSSIEQRKFTYRHGDGATIADAAVAALPPNVKLLGVDAGDNQLEIMMVHDPKRGAKFVMRSKPNETG